MAEMGLDRTKIIPHLGTQDLNEEVKSMSRGMGLSPQGSHLRSSTVLTSKLPHPHLNLHMATLTYTKSPSVLMAFNGTRGSVAASGEPIPPGKTMSMEQHLVDKGAQMMQSLAPVKQMKQHVCTFALYSHDLTRRIEAHHALCDSHQPGFPSVRCLQFHRPPHRLIYITLLIK
ncbi:hypothetical protein LguiA_025006 [Lonicera macranthoides]